MAGQCVPPGCIQELQTPCFLVDLDKVKVNTDTMRGRCVRLGVSLRPHMKTAKTIEVGELATGGTRRRICVSTLREAEFFAEAGFDDIKYAMLFAQDRIPRMQALSLKLEKFHVVVDNEAGLDLLEKNSLPGDRKWSVFMLVDTGSKREGCPWDQPETLQLGLRLFRSPAVHFRGLYTHEGATYSRQGQADVAALADTAVDRLLKVKDRLLAEGVECEDVTIGATPSASLPGDNVSHVTEVHPGNYVFYDVQQFAIGSCSESDIACRVATRVIGQYPLRHQLLVDAGWSALSREGPMANGSFGKVQGFPHIRVVNMNQEYGFIEYDPDQHSVSDFPLGTLLYVYPYHSCATAMMHKQYYVHEGETITGVWTPCSQW